MGWHQWCQLLDLAVRAGDSGAELMLHQIAPPTWPDPDEDTESGEEL